MNKSDLNWIAWYVYYEPPCEGREDIGFFKTELDADMSKCKFAEKNNLHEYGICCSNIKYIYKKQILVK